jgi:hypothetical protein
MARLREKVVRRHAPPTLKLLARPGLRSYVTGAAPAGVGGGFTDTMLDAL